MAKNAALAWWQLATDSYWLWVDSSAVIAMRSVGMMTGAPGSQKEAVRMVTEKIAANAELAAMLFSGAQTSPEHAARKAVTYYGAKVRANRKRLARSGS